MPCRTPTVSLTPRPPAAATRAAAKRSRASRHADVVRGLVDRRARTSARTTSRASASEPSSPSAIACTSRLPSSVASAGPGEHGQAGGAPPSSGRAARCARRRRRRGSRPAPSPVTAREQVDRLGVLEREALEDAADDRAGVRRARAGPCARRTRAIARRHVAGLGEDGSFGSTKRARAAAPSVGERDELVERVARALAAPTTRRHSCRSQSPVTLRSSRNVPPTPPSFVRFAAKRRVVDHRLARPRRRRATTCRR